MAPRKKTDPVRERRGRPPRVEPTHEIVAEIVNLIEKGTYPLSAARAVDIPRRTWYEWLANGEKVDADPRFAHLAHSVEKAKGRLASRYYATINDAALGHEEALRDAKGNVIFVPDDRGKPAPIMVKVPGNWYAASRALESLTPDEFLRVSGGSPKGGAGEGGDDAGQPDFQIVYLTSNRDPKELREIERKVAERAGRT